MQKKINLYCVDKSKQTAEKGIGPTEFEGVPEIPEIKFLS